MILIKKKHFPNLGWWGFEEGMSTWCSPQCWLAPQVSKCCERVKESGLFSLPEKTLKVSNPLDRIIPRGAGSPPGVSILYVLYTLYRVYPCSPQSSRFLPSSPYAQHSVALPTHPHVIYKVNRCLARYSRAPQPPTYPPTGHWISLHGLVQIDQKCQFWTKFGRFWAKNSFFYRRNQKFCYLK